MSPDRQPGGPALWWQIWSAEGTRAVVARALDRLAEARRRRTFRAVSRPPTGFVSPVLNLAAAPPAPRLGGVQAQLLWRLDAESALRPVALLYPEPRAATATASPGRTFRLELQRGHERWALRRPPAGGTQGSSAPPVRAEPGTAAAPGPGGTEHGTRAIAAAGAIGATGNRDAVAGLAAFPFDPAVALVDPDFEAAVTWAAGCIGASALHVEGLAGMPLGSLLRLAHRGLRLIVAPHDFAAFCARPHLLEIPAPPAPPRFCHYSRDAARCARCLAQTWPHLPSAYQEQRRRLAQDLLAAASAVVFPSAFLARTYAQLFPAAASAWTEPTVIAPALPPAAVPTAGAGVAGSSGAGPAPDATSGSAHGSAASRARWPPRHIAWIGAVHAHKGALVFEAAARELAAARHRLLQLSAYGGGDRQILARWRRIPGLRARGYYRAGSLAALLRRDRIDLALLLSIVPESYGLALDECTAAGVPVVAFALGALGERLTPAAGLLLDPTLADDSAAAGQHLAKLLASLLDCLSIVGDNLSIASPTALPLDPSTLTASVIAARWIDLYHHLGLLAPKLKLMAGR